MKEVGLVSLPLVACRVIHEGGGAGEQHTG